MVSGRVAFLETMTAHKPNILPKLTRELFVSKTVQMKYLVIKN